VTNLIPKTAEIVFMSEGSCWNYNSEPYNLTNASLANVRRVNQTTTKTLVTHRGLNYLFWDGHVSHELFPPHSLGGEFGEFDTVDGATYIITTADNNTLRQRLIGR